MKFILLFGPQAVGKMTVGQELANQTGLKLLHNHMTIELLQPFFGFSQEMWRLSTLFRQEIFKSFLKSGQDGLIFTFVWGLDLESDWTYVEQLTRMFEEGGADVCWVELKADLEERVKRNATPNRLQHKPTKRDVERSERDLRKTMEEHRLNSFEGEIQRANYFCIDNTNLSPAETAARIKERFQL